jgi:hypothetical protein
LEEVMKAHWFDALCKAIAAYTDHCWTNLPNDIPNSGDLFSSFSIGSQPVGLNRLNRYFRNWLLSNRYIYPWYMHISSMNSRKYAYKQFLMLDQFSIRAWMKKLPIAFMKSEDKC